jgi:putative copper resistance protein D
MPVVAVLAVWLYIRGTWRLRSKDRQWATARTVSFSAGCVIVGTSIFVSDSTFTSHMIENVLLGMIGPLLIVVAAPMTLALQSARPATRLLLRKFLRTRAVAIVTRPLVGWLLFGGTLVGLYLVPLVDVSERNVVVHTLVHVHLFVVGSLFLWPLVGADPLPSRLPHGGRLLAVLVAVPFHAFVGLALFSADSPAAPLTYPSLTDQRRAAALLLVSGELLSLVVGGLVFREWLAADRREAARFDRRVGA